MYFGSQFGRIKRIWSLEMMYASLPFERVPASTVDFCTIQHGDSGQGRNTTLVFKCHLFYKKKPQGINNVYN